MQELPVKPAYNVDEVSALMGFSRSTIIRLFENEPGVICLGRPETLHKRRYRSIRIPRHVYERVLARLTKRPRSPRARDAQLGRVTVMVAYT